MPRPLFDSPYLFGIHEPGGEQEMVRKGRPGWVLFTEELGHDPANLAGKDFSAWSNQDLGVICRINHGYEPNGTLPPSSLYQNFAVRCANYVRASQGCKIWIIGNEPNLAVERPGVQIDWNRAAYLAGTRGAGQDEPSFPLTYRDLPDRFSALLPPDTRSTRRLIVNPGEVITPQLYAQCYRLCRAAIRAQPGHADDQVLVAPVAPWNIDTTYPGNPGGDWVVYFQDILRLIGPENCDGIALHTYAHGTDLRFIYDDLKMGNPAFAHRRYHFRTYRDFMEVIPPAMRGLPIYITEANQNDPWLNTNIGWVQRAYAEIDHWNKQPGNQQIRALILYRWPRIDRWYIEGKSGVIEDFRQALNFDYRWSQAGAPVQPGQPPAGTSYGTQWEQVVFPPAIQVGQVIAVKVVVKNTSSFVWPRGGDNPVRLGYKLFDDSDRPVVLPFERNLRTYLPKDVAVGASVTVDASVAVPSQPGHFTIQIDLFHFQETWFADQGAAPYRTQITVGAGGALGGGDLQIVDLAEQMPKGATPYQPRDLSKVRHLVINHTAVRPTVDIALIANVHIQRGYPGIAYEYVVDDRGRIFQVSPLDAVVRADQEWSGQGINICLSGDFTSAPPPAAQLTAAGNLCAWLADGLGLTSQAVVGAGALLSTASPGDTFYTGPTWRNTLVQIMEQRLQAPPPPPQPEPEPQPQPQPEPQPQPQPQPQPGSTLVVQPPIQDVILDLPRNTAGLTRRSLGDIRFIVINHTAVDPSVSVERIAQAHMARLPGILYQFFIGSDGQILQTQPLMEVVDPSQPYIKNGINVAFAGSFNNAVPSPAQLQAGGQLVAWLLEQFPQIGPEQVRGVREFIPHSSPGDQWSEGQNWKALLFAAIQNAERFPAPAIGGENPQVQALLAQIAQLQQQIQRNGQELNSLRDQLQTAQAAAAQAAQLSQQLQTLESQYETLYDHYQSLQRANQLLQDQVATLEAEVARLQAQSGSGAPGGDTAPSGPVPVSKPPMTYKVTALHRHPTLRYDRRSLNQITAIAVHHTAIRPDVGPERIAELHVLEDLSRGKQAWPGIGYHFFIHESGAIDQCNDLETVSYHVFMNNAYAVGIVLAGSFMNGVVPTLAQMASLAHLTAWLMQELHIPSQRVLGHREFPDNATVCPGTEWTEGKRWRQEFLAQVQQVQRGEAAKSLQHYLLFWQRGFPGSFAEADLRNATDYIRRFRPNLGFSVEAARQARYVTIVGGDAGVSGADEQRLRAAGCLIERIAGRNEAETAQMLAAKVQANRRHSQMDPEP